MLLASITVCLMAPLVLIDYITVTLVAPPVSLSARYCIPQCVRLIASGGRVRVGSGVHDSYTFPVQGPYA